MSSDDDPKCFRVNDGQIDLTGDNWIYPLFKLEDSQFDAIATRVADLLWQREFRREYDHLKMWKRIAAPTSDPELHRPSVVELALHLRCDEAEAERMLKVIGEHVEDGQMEEQISSREE